ncbi:MAG: hypothetical protein N2746_02565 [Deltaproteobacteria bacterium]|nr:hypothetical protein [Deltaproteobacteria bacterium]
MIFRIYLTVLITTILLTLEEAYAAKIRLTTSTGFSLRNEFSSETAGIYGAGLHLLYPINDETRIINTEIGAANWYNYYTLSEREMHTIRFGLAIRVYLNAFEKITPFFTHDILSQITYLTDRKDNAATYSIILGLGARLLQQNGLLSSLFAEITYSRFGLGYFEIEKRIFSFMAFNVGAEF